MKGPVKLQNLTAHAVEIVCYSEGLWSESKGFSSRLAHSRD